MVEEKITTSYLCEICGAKFEDFSLAKDCEERGIEGPTLDKGWIWGSVKNFGNSKLYIFNDEIEPTKHDRQYSFVVVTTSENHFGDFKESMIFTPNNLTYMFSHKNPSALSLLDEKDYEFALELIQRNSKMSKLREFLESQNITEFHRRCKFIEDFKEKEFRNFYGMY